MATEITSISELSTTDVKEQQTILTEFLAELYPTIDIKHGVLHDLVQYVNAIFSAKERTELERWKSARSLLAITEDPTIADDDSVDHILSNYNITRKEATTASGIVLLEFSSNASFIIPSGLVFSYSDLEFTTSNSFLVLPNGSTSNIADRILTQLDNGNYGTTIPVTASQTGSSSCLKRGTVLTCTGISGLETARAYNNFVGGVDAETNDELLVRLKSGIATQCWGNRDNIKNLLLNNEALSTAVDISVVGMNDAEMLRDQTSIFPISLGGKVDIYVKTAPFMTTTTVKLLATCTQTEIDYATYSCTVPAESLYGMWRVTAVEKEADGVDNDTIELVNQTKESTNTELSADEASYSKYSAINLVFKLYTTDTIEVGSTAYFNITVMGINDVSTVQSICSDRNIMPVNSDVLVKSVVPCIVTINVHLKQNKSNTISDTTSEAIKNSIVATINNKGFSGFIAASELTQSFSDLLTTGQVVTSMQLTGTILGPTGILYRDTNNKQLIVPSMPLNYITKNTVSFFSDITYIDIETETIDE